MAATTTREAKKPGGRPRAARGAGERSTLSLRITADLFARLDAEAKRKGRALSNEAETRLEWSFAIEDLLPQALGLAYGRRAVGFLMALMDIIALEARAGMWLSGKSAHEVDDWPADPYAYRRAANAAAEALAAFKPPGEVIIDPALERGGAVYVNFARMFLEAVKDRAWQDRFPAIGQSFDLERRAAKVRALLGPEIVDTIQVPGGDS